MSAVSVEHIEVDRAGVARVVGSRTKVIQIVMDRMANGWTADEIHRQYPHLSLAGIHAAFAFYYDHQAELDAQIQQTLDDADQHARQTPVPDLVSRLRQKSPP